MREAACHCGQLRVTVSAEPFAVSICNCLACQRRTGSAFGYQARFPADRVETSGEARQYVRIAEHGASRTFSFCPACGATVWYVLGDAPGMVAVPVGAFADPGFPAPRVSVWEGRRHAWVGLPEGIVHEPD